MEFTTIKVTTPLWGAGKKYSWNYEDLVGFSCDYWLLKQFQGIRFKTNDGIYFIGSNEAKKICDKFSAYFNDSRNRYLAIIPRSACIKLK